MRLEKGQGDIVKCIRKGGRYEEVMHAVRSKIGHHVYEYVMVEELIDIIRRLATK
jgi:hypothetical protein